MSTTAIYEIAPDLFRLSIYVPDFDMQFNHFLVRDEEPLLFHAGLKGMFPALREAVAKIIDPAKLRHIAWSHFESDEIGALNDWLQVAPRASLVKRAEVAGYKAIVFTVDVPLLGRRERDVRNRFKLPGDLSVKNLLPAGLQEFPDGTAGSRLAPYIASLFDPALTWKDIEWLAGITNLIVLCSKRSLAVRALSSSDALSYGDWLPVPKPA
jgi:hypothetical protein